MRLLLGLKKKEPVFDELRVDASEIIGDGSVSGRNFSVTRSLFPFGRRKPDVADISVVRRGWKRAVTMIKII